MKGSSLLLAAVFTCSAVFAVPAAVSTTTKYCTLPPAGGSYEKASPSEVQVDADIVQKAVNQFAVLGTVSIKVFRYNCLIAESPLDLITDALRKNLFSATKGVVSMLAGIAMDQGKLDIDAPIDNYLPTGPGWGDAAHRAITVRQLLTESAGLDSGVAAEGVTILTETSIPQAALALPFIAEPGSKFIYSQRIPDLLAYVVERAVGEDFQDFAQQYLFTPVGIPEDSYIWLRDRGGHTYGYAYLFLSSPSFARLGLLMQNEGVWRGTRVISSSYVKAVSVPSAHNGCYGLLFWTNRGDYCISPTGYQFPPRSWIPGTPRDLFAMSGSPQQKNFMIPSLNMTVSWAGILNVVGPDRDTWYKFFRMLMPGILDLAPLDPGVFTMEPKNLNATLEAFDLKVLKTGLFASPSCNILICNKKIPLVGLIQNILQILGLAKFTLTNLLNDLI